MELLSPSTIRLDRENICAIGRLQSLQEIHSLYLQQVRYYGRCGAVEISPSPGGKGHLRGDHKHPKFCSRVCLPAWPEALAALPSDDNVADGV